MNKKDKLINVLKETFKNHSISIEDYNQTKTYILFVVEPFTGKIVFHNEAQTLAILADNTISKLKDNKFI